MKTFVPPSIEIGREGELLAANVRLAVGAIGIALPVAFVCAHPADAEPWVALAGVLVMLLLGWTIREFASRSTPPSWLGAVTAVADVTLISGVNAALVVAGQPHAATSGRVFFSLYLVALSFTCLRFRTSLCVIAGATAIVQYAAIVIWAAPRAIDPGLANPTYGAFRWDNQIARIVILILATAINVTVVRQSRRFIDASLHDLLTGIANRRHCELRLAAAVASGARTGRTLLVALADIDHFKRVNDRFGHGAGDEALRTVARSLRDFVRASDLVGRWGGEEFLILCEDTDAGGALDRIRDFHRRFAEEAIALPRANLRLTLSIGVAVFPADGRSVTELIACADRRLYAAKAAGRDCVIASDAISIARQPA